MNLEFTPSFARDLRKLQDKRLSASITEIITQVKQAGCLQDVSNIKKLKGESGYYRIRVGDYRLGILVEGDTILFVRFLHRKEIYRFFP